MQCEKHEIRLGGETVRFATLTRPTGPSGDLVLFLHGLGCVKECFAPALTVAALAPHGLLVPDLPGSGGTPAPAGFACRMEDYAAAVRALLSQFTFRRLHLVAHSMGAAVGLLLAEAGDLPLASFVNVEGNLTADDCGLLSRRAAQTPQDLFVAEKFAKIVAKAAAAPDPTTQAWAAWMGRTDPRAFHRAAVSLVAWSDGGRLLSIFKALAVPKAYVYGARSVNPAVLACLDAIPRIEIAEAGHFLMTARPAAFLGAVADVLNRA